jgi:trimethylamine--corrinoid protein Co-methyltransferase
LVFVPKIGILEPLSSDELTKIHAASLEILEEIGVIVDDESTLRLLDGAGALVDWKAKKVKISGSLVEESIRSAPQSVTMAGRDRKYDLTLEGKRVHFGLGGGALNIIDPNTGLHRPSTKRDVETAARLADALPNVDFAMSLGCCRDVPKEAISLHSYEAMLRNTEKPIMEMDYGIDMDYLIRMAAVIAGGEEELQRNPVLCVYSEPISPLRHGEVYLRNVRKLARVKLPVAYIPSPLSGLTAPITVAGLTAQANAEALSGLVIIQLTSKGAPVIYGANAATFEMRTGVGPYGAPEWMLTNLIFAQLGRRYGLPVWSTGGCSDAKALDQQAASEAMATLFVAAASGANLVHDFGFLDFGLTGSLELVALCDEFASMIERVLGSLEVTDEALALDVIGQVGPGGNFITHRHTLKRYKEEHWFPNLIDRWAAVHWKAKGSKSLGDRANERVRAILDSHSPAQLPGDVARQLGNIIKQAEKASTS